MELLTPRLILRSFREQDYASLRELELCPQTAYYESARFTDQQVRAYLRQAQEEEQHAPRTCYRFAITLPFRDQVCGRVKLTLLNAGIREWEIGWALHPDLWGQGLATEAAQRVLRFAFEELKVHRVVAFSHAENAASLRLMNRLGLLQEGRLRHTRWWQGGWCDEVVYAMLESEWLGDS